MDNFVADKSVPKKEDKQKDVFADDWTRAREYWVAKHPIFDRNYLFYKGISVIDETNSGFSFSKYFGTQVFVPRTFQTVESLYAQLSSREMEFSSVGKDFMSDKKKKYIERMDNAEFLRSRAREAVMESFHDSLLMGNGYLLNLMTEDKKLVHIPEVEQVEEDGKKINRIKWAEEWMVKYKGVKPRALNPYNVFPDPQATSMDDWRYCYVYSTIAVSELREFVVGNGWMSEEEAEKKIQSGEVERFDSVRNTIDLAYSRTTGTFQLAASANKDATSLRDDTDMIGIVERYEPDGYELRVNNSEETLYKDHNVYLHKEIPIVIIHDYKLPHELLAQGEPEIIRWQQIEENKIHNLVLYGTLMGVVQRYAVNSSLLEDPSDAAFYDPFRPIKVKAGLGGSVLNAVQPMPQPDLKQSPFKLMELVKEISQQTTGATDMLVAASQSMADTATESNNLMSATAQRVRAKIRNVEMALSRMVNQWHKCYIQFYDDEMDLNEDSDSTRFFKFIPYKREEAETNEVLMKEASEKLNAMGKTLTEIYLNKGYQMVVYLSDLDGTWDTQATVKDSAMFFNQTVDTYTKLVTALGQINNMEQASGGMRQFDLFKMGEDMLRVFPMIVDSAAYVKENEAMKAQQDAQKQQQTSVTPPPLRLNVGEEPPVEPMDQAMGGEMMDELPMKEGGEMM